MAPLKIKLLFFKTQRKQPGILLVRLLWFPSL